MDERSGWLPAAERRLALANLLHPLLSAACPVADALDNADLLRAVHGGPLAAQSANARQLASIDHRLARLGSVEARLVGDEFARRTSSSRLVGVQALARFASLGLAYHSESWQVLLAREHCY
jgi:hypothetical protein